VLQQELVWVQVEQEQLVQVQLFVVEVAAHFEMVGFAAAGCHGFPISN